MKIATLNKKLKHIGLILVIDFPSNYADHPTYIHLMWLSTYKGFIKNPIALAKFRKFREEKYERT